VGIDVLKIACLESRSGLIISLSWLISPKTTDSYGRVQLQFGKRQTVRTMANSVLLSLATLGNGVNLLPTGLVVGGRRVPANLFLFLGFRSLGRFSDGRVHVAGWRFFLRVFCQDRFLQDYHFSLHRFEAHTPQNRVLIPD
jgi:hypothetical protein